MRKFILMLFAIILTSVGYAQGSMDFENVTLPSNYSDGSFTEEGITYTYGHSRDDDGFEINGQGLMLRRASDSYFEWTVPDGVGTLVFQYRKAYTGGTARQLEVYINGSPNFITDEFGSGGGEQDNVYTFSDIIDETGPVTIKIKNVGISGSNKQTTIDNISWTSYDGEGGDDGDDQTGCEIPDNLSASNITEMSADLYWEPVAGDFEIYIIEEGGAAPDMDTTPTDVAENTPYQATDLQESTNYEFYVRKVCDGENSEWSNPGYFETDGGADPGETGSCEVIEADWDGHETFTNFELEGSPVYQSGSFTGQDGIVWFYEDTRDDKDINANAITLRNNASSFLKSEPISGEITSLQFSYMQAFSNQVNLNVYVIVDGDEENAELVGNVTTDSSESEVPKCSGVIDISELGITNNFQILFKNASGGNQVAIDDVTWTVEENGSEPQECLAPSNMQTDVSYNSVTLSWTGAANADIFVRGTGDATPDANTAPTYSGVSSPYEITFTDHAERMFYVRNNCGADDYSEWITDNQYVYNPAEDECRFRFEFITQGEVDFFPQVIDEETGEYYLDAHFTIEDGYYSHTVWSANPVYFTMDFQGWNEAGTSITVYGFVGNPLGNNEELVYSEYIELDEDSEFVDAYLDCDLNPSEPEVGCVVDSGDWDGYETFENLLTEYDEVNPGDNTSPGAFTNGTFLGQDGSTWEYVKAIRNTEINGKALELGRNQTPPSKVTSGVLHDGISFIQFSYMQLFGTDVNVEVYVINNDNPDGLLVAGATSSSQQNEALCSGVIDLSSFNIYGDFQLSFRNPSGAGQVSIDDITWTSNEAPPCTEFSLGAEVQTDCVEEDQQYEVKVVIFDGAAGNTYTILDGNSNILEENAVVDEEYTFHFSPAETDVEIYAFENGNSSCTAEPVQIDPPAVCEPIPCDISLEVEVQTECVHDGDTEYWVKVTLSGTEEDSSYGLKDGNGAVLENNVIVGEEYIFEFQPTEDVTLIAFKYEDPGCIDEVTVQSPEYCPPVCDISLTATPQTDCVEEDGTFEVYVTINGESSTDDFFTITDGFMNVLEEEASIGVEYTFELDVTAADYEIYAYGNIDDSCVTDTVVVEIPTICEPIPCDISVELVPGMLLFMDGVFEIIPFGEDSCIDEGGSFVVGVEISGSSNNSSYVITDDQGSDPKTGAVPGGFYYFEYNAGVNPTITVTGEQDDTCYVTESTNSPEFCEVPCVAPTLTYTWGNMDNGEVVAADCIDEAGEYYVAVEIEGGSGNDTYTLFDDNNEYETATTTGGPYIFGPYSAESTNDILAMGNDDDNCSAEITVSAVVCDPVPCEAPTLTYTWGNLDNGEVVATDCIDEAGEYYVAVEIEGGSGNATYTLLDDDTMYDEATTADGPYIFGPYAANSENEILWEGNDDGDCEGSLSVSADVCVPEPCEINLTAVAQTDCVAADGTYEVYVTLSGSSAEASYTIIDGDDNELETAAVIGEAYTFSFAAGSDVEIYAYGNDDENCDTEVVEVASPAICIPPCDEPTDIMISDITHESALVSWSQTGTPVQWAVSYGLQGFDFDTEGTDVYVDFADGPSVVLTGLSPEHTYDVYVYAVCEDDTSTLAGPETFSTTAAPIVCDEEHYYISRVWANGPGDIEEWRNSGFDNDDPLSNSAISTPVTTPGYANTGLVYTLDRTLGNTLSFEIHTDGNHPGLTYNYQVWVDRNLDGVFSNDGWGDYTELLLEVSTAAGDGSIIGAEFNLDGPEIDEFGENLSWCDIPEGNFPMRIIMTVYNEDCDEVYGETEDYIFFVTGDCNSRLSVDDYAFENFTFYPNPVETEINLSAASVIENVQVYNLLGQKVIETTPNATQAQIDAEGLSSGVYMMKVTIEGAEKTFKVVRK